MPGVIVLSMLFFLLCGCATGTPSPEATNTVITGPGPYIGTEIPPTPAIVPYPEQFTLQEMQTLLGQSLDPRDLYANPTYAADAKANIEIVKGWCELSTTCPRNITYETIYLPEATRYSTVAVDDQGNVAAWGSFVNPDKTRSYFQQAFWDAQLAGWTTGQVTQAINEGKIAFDMPPLQTTGDHWTAVMTPSGYTILVEVDPNNQPVQSYDALTRSFKPISGLPTPTFRPTETPAPTAEALVYNPNRATIEGEFTPTTDDQKQTLIKDIENSWMLDENITTSFHLSLLAVNPDGTSYMRSTCLYGQNCVVRASIVQDIEIEGKIYKVYQYVWEMVVDKQHRVVVTTHSTGILNVEGEQENWDKIAGAQTGAHVNFRFETGANPAHPFNGPRELWLANEPRNPQAMADFKARIIDEDMSDNILRGSDISVINP